MYKTLEARSTDSEHRGLHTHNGLGSSLAGIISRTRKLITQIVAVLIVLSAMLGQIVLTSTPAYATDPPDSVQFVSVQINRHLYEDDDYMLMLHYAINYGSLPDDPIDETFIFRLLDTDGVTELGGTTAYPFTDDGYGHGIVTLYWEADEAPAWDGLYILRISGNPAAFVSPPAYNYTLVASDYSSETDQEGNRDDMTTWLLDVAMELEVEWDASLLDLTDTGVCLSTTGESYFRYAVPGLQVLAPDIFYVQVAQPDWEGTTYNTTQGDEYVSRWDGTWVGYSLQDGASLVDVEPTTISGIIILAVIIGLIIVSAKRFQTTLPGYVAGIALGVSGWLMGWISPEIGAVIAMFLALYTGYFLLFQRA